MSTDSTPTSARPALYLALILGLFLIAVMLLGLRQQRLVLTAQLTETVSRIDQARLELWDTQADLAKQTHPGKLAQTLEASGIEMVPARPLALPPTRYVSADTGVVAP